MAAFASQLDPRVNDIADIKTAVSEAVTNCIVHAYRDSPLPPEKRMVELRGEYYGDGRLVMTIKDCGRGISDIKQAMERFSQPTRREKGAEWASPSWNPSPTV